MELNEQITKIKKIIYELSPDSYGVVELMKQVQQFPELIEYLKFPSIKELKDYLQDGNYSDYAEIQKEVDNFIQNKEKYIDDEMDEIQRTVQDLSRNEGIDITVDELSSILKNTSEVTIPQDVLDKLENTECQTIKKGEMKKVVDLAKRYNKTNPKDLKSSLLKGEYDRPLIVKFGDRYHLIAGNTRLCTAAALGLKPKVLIGNLNITN